MEYTYFKLIGQKSTNGKIILVAVVPDNLLGEDLPMIFEAQAFKMPETIYTGTYPQIKINTDTIKDISKEMTGMGIGGIITSAEWYNESVKKDDDLGISLSNNRKLNNK